MKNTHITQPQFAMIWFGAALSIAEIMTGTYLAPLGLIQGLYAIILGHIIGGILLFGAGLIGGRLRQGSMNTTAFSFGPLGAKGFAFLNMLQLIGWTSIMIYDAMLALQELAPLSPMIWTIAIGALVILWLFIGRDASRMRFLFGSYRRPLYQAAGDITPEDWRPASS